MKYRNLGTTGLEVSSLCLGTYTLSAAWGTDLDAGRDAVRTAIEEGITFFDTAWAYGRAEMLFGEAIMGTRDYRRESVVLCGKVGLGLESRPDARTPFVPNSDPVFLRSALHKSLARIGTEYLDVYLIHWYDPKVPIEDVAGAMGEFIEEGLVRAVGVSNYTVEQMARFHAVTPLGVAQVPYSVLSRQVEVDVLPYLASIGAGVMGYAALAQGYLTGTFTQPPAFAADDFRATGVDFVGDVYEARVHAVEAMRPIASRLGCTVAQLALAWVLASPNGVIATMGAQVPEHVLASVPAVDVILTEADRAEITAIAETVPEMDFAGLVS
jgi:hypothetical protein